MGSVLLNPDEIKVSERGRQFFGEEGMKELVESIAKYGQLQNIGITPNNVLIWGERRLRACKELGIQVSCTIKEADETILMELEDEENDKREDLTATEKILRTAKRHEHYEYVAGKEGIVWSLDDTALRLGVSKSTVHSDYNAAVFLRTMPHLFNDSMSKTEIKSKVKALQEQMQFKRNQEKIEDMKIKGQMPNGTVPYIEIQEVPQEMREEINAGQEERIREALEMQRLVEIPTISNEDMLKGKLISFEERLGIGDAYEHLDRLQDEIVSIMLLDPPWGIDIDKKADGGKLRGRSYTDSEEDFTRQFPILCKLCYEKMREDSHLYCFFGIKHLNFVYDSLEEAGFITNRRPIMAYKTNRRSTRVPDKWPAACYEPIAFAHKGQRRLVRKGEPDLVPVKWPTPTEKKGHISAKPPEIYKDLLIRSAHPNDFVCDPMYGSGASFVACELIPELNLQWFGWDIDEVNKSAALMALTEVAIRGYGGEEE